MSHHLIISGTGRTGTTFLMQLLTELGLDTGFPDARSGLFENSNAGMEWDPWSPELPYVLKGPFLCYILDELLETRDIVIDHAIIPVRDLFAAAESRRDVERRTEPGAAADPATTSPWLAGLVPGGPVPGDPGDSQEAALAKMLHTLVLVLTRREIPMTFLDFPRLVSDHEYLYRRIGPLLPGVDATRFAEACASVARPELVHEFEAGPPP
jgi:hypothetical protein